MLPPRLVAGQPATLAAFGADGKLAPGVTVDLGGVQRVQTDKTGRAYFLAPTNAGVLIAKAAGSSAAALVDSIAPAVAPVALHVAPVVSLRDRFSICGAGLRGDANDNLVKINGEPSLVLAASPECLVVLAGPNAVPGAATISIASSGPEMTAAATLVALDFSPPNPPLQPEKKSALAVRVQGSDQPLWIVVVNETPGVLRFVMGDAQKLRTTGGPQNLAELKVTAIRSGDFSFHARLVPPPDVGAARQYLQAAVLLAGKDLQPEIKSLAKRLAHHPRDSTKIQAELEPILSQTMAGDFRTLLDAASSALE